MKLSTVCWGLLTAVVHQVHYVRGESVAANCSSSAIPPPAVPGTRVLSVTAAPVSNYNATTALIDFCNVTVVYTHPGWNDSIVVTTWLPLRNWTGRLVGSGGGGWSMRSVDSVLAAEVVAGRAVVATDGGHVVDELDAAQWAIDPSGAVRTFLLQDFASVTLNDAALMGKAVARGFYGAAPRYAYWSGCSTGGRQGHMLAQRYPNAYDGILAVAPAINWGSLIPAMVWPMVVMHELGVAPPQCVLETIVNAAVAACDGLDGLLDGIVSAPERCAFDPHTLVGRSIDCGELGRANISAAHATLVQKIWQGPTTPAGESLWYGHEPGAGLFGVANTKCSGSPTNCTGVPFAVAHDWVRLFVIGANTPFDISRSTYAEYATLFAASKAKAQDIISTNNPDLSGFKAAGGKLLSWHGLADPGIPPRGTKQFYDRVQAFDPRIRDFFRHFEAPGAGHCQGGVVPLNPLDALIDWVEHGVAPDTLLAASPNLESTRPLCPYPLVSAYIGGDKKKASSYACRTNFTAPV